MREGSASHCWSVVNVQRHHFRCERPHKRGPSLLSPPAAGADHALDQRDRADDSVHERPHDLQRASGSVLGQVIVYGTAADSRDRRARKSGERRDRLHENIRPRVQNHRRSRIIDGAERSRGGAGVPFVDDDPRFPMAVDGARMALLFCVDFRHQWPLLHRVFALEPASVARSSADARPVGRNRPIDQGSPAVSPREGRSGHALQRSAKARLSRRHLRFAAARDPDGTRDVAADRYVFHWLDRSVRRAAIGAHDSFHRGVADRRVRADPRVPGDRHRLMEQPALDDHARACRMRASVRDRVVPESPFSRRANQPCGADARHRTQSDGAGISRGRPVAELSQQWNCDAG